jgi:hypothetical protein
MKKILIALCFFTFVQVVNGQQKNKIDLITGPIWFPLVYNEPRTYIFSHYGISYEHQIKKRISIGVSFSRWSRNHYHGSILVSKIEFEVDSIHPKTQTGYQFYNLFANFSILDTKYHNISIAPEFSIAKGQDDYIVKAFFIERPDGTPHLVGYEFLSKWNPHAGTGFGVKYQAKLLNQHLLLGINSKLSYYHNHFLQWTYGINAGYSF